MTVFQELRDGDGLRRHGRAVRAVGPHLKSPRFIGRHNWTQSDRLHALRTQPIAGSLRRMSSSSSDGSRRSAARARHRCASVPPRCRTPRSSTTSAACCRRRASICRSRSSRTFDEPNELLAAGQLDANFFQYLPFLDEFNRRSRADLVPIVPVHIEPFGLYSNRIGDLDAIPDNAEIALPADPVNVTRSLAMLDDLGLIECPIVGDEVVRRPSTSRRTPMAWCSRK